MDFLAVSSDQSLGARQHFLSGPSRESEKKNSLGFDAAIDQMGNSIDKRSSFSSAGTGDDQKRPISVCRGRSLLGIQVRSKIAI